MYLKSKEQCTILKICITVIHEQLYEMLLDKLSIHLADKFPIILLGMCSPVILIQEKKVMHIWTKMITCTKYRSREERYFYALRILCSKATWYQHLSTFLLWLRWADCLAMCKNSLLFHLNGLFFSNIFELFDKPVIKF